MPYGFPPSINNLDGLAKLEGKFIHHSIVTAVEEFNAVFNDAASVLVITSRPDLLR